MKYFIQLEIWNGWRWVMDTDVEPEHFADRDNALSRAHELNEDLPDNVSWMVY